MNPNQDQPENKNEKGARNALVQADRYMSIAFILPICIFVGYAIGWWIDKHYATHWATMTFVLVGVVAGFVSMIREITRNS